MTKTAAAVLVLIVVASIQGARADCRGDAAALRATLRDGKSEAHREEAIKLAEKAEIDGRKGREQLCREALARARGLAK